MDNQHSTMEKSVDSQEPAHRLFHSTVWKLVIHKLHSLCYGDRDK